MKWRVALLSVLLILRLVMNWFEIEKYEVKDKLKVTGNIINIYHNNSECIIIVGRFWINYRSKCNFSRMDKVVVVGNIKRRVTDMFLGRLWLDSAEIEVIKNESNIQNGMSNEGQYFYRFREKLVDKYLKYLPEPEAGLVAGIVLGYQGDIGGEMYELMKQSGTIHIAVASGYNVMLMGGAVMSLCFWLVRRGWASLIAIMAMIFYAILAGGEPPVARAVIMGAAVLLAALWGRKAVSWWILLVTGWLMILVEPLLVVNVSFQLSMAASAGLMVGEPFLRRQIDRIETRWGDYLSGSGVLSSLATMTMTMPIIWWHFAKMSWIGILSNILILPLIPPLMIFGVLMQVLPGVFLWPTYAIAHWMVKVIAFFGS